MGYGTGIGQRTAVVTGAGSLSGIGYATARRFLEEGWAVALLDINAEGVQNSAAALREESGAGEGTVFATCCDVTDENSVSAAAAAISESGLPPVGALANIAGIPSPVPFLEVDLALWNKIIDINLTGCFLTCRAFLPAMIEGGYGRIVNMSSVSAQQGGGVFSKTPYSAAKAGVLGLTRSLAREMAEYNITVNAVSPGIVATDIRSGASDEQNEARLSASVPLKRQASARDIASAYVWLCSEDAGYVTGTTQNVNGGAYIA
jgi:2-hydroxycyclohexanecarboxyl-CoA dehydrogenase